MRFYKLLFLIIFFQRVCVLNAQDTIFFSTGKPLAAKVLEITEEHIIKYKQIDSHDSTTYSVKCSDVNKVKYKDGSEDIFERVNNDSLKAEKVNTFQNKFDINNSATINMLQGIAKKAGSEILFHCKIECVHFDTDVFLDQAFKDESTGEINLPVKLRWDVIYISLDPEAHFIKGTIKISPTGKKTWICGEVKGKKYLSCAKSIKDL